MGTKPTTIGIARSARAGIPSGCTNAADDRQATNGLPQAVNASGVNLIWLSTGVDPYRANLDRVYGRDPKRSPATTEPFPLEAQSVLPALQARHRDRPGRPQRDNDIVEQYCNPSKGWASQ
jgi:hypothetical protein